MKSAEVDGISDYKHTHLHICISPSINSFIGIGSLPLHLQAILETLMFFIN